ncbi:SDR family NAD(P)-dependent oxidoreductase [Asticcacaulis sp. YBE204]|uniref:SDR family NAD(P)-dependent oxidoreductase n=1 Tax=Asticcacaulis sp. YBE204 TaxID=1282363 RepID=UPI0003C3CAA5|nr:SDR family NAD(P)-dependent oxidoreductase [Asticcacaulis sp. YBE204]ESQ79821.1 short-chain dehydrogenase [Asticcacaulis sp. YBE204]
MSLSNQVIVVTGANRGIGAATVRELLTRDVKKIYAAARNTASLPDFNDPRVVALTLDITNDAQVKAAAETAADADVILNNAGTAIFTDVLNSPLEEIGSDFNANFYGTLRVMQAFAPKLVARGSGTIANVISVVGLVAVASLGGYSASKAALLSVTQSARAGLKDKGVKVLGIFPGPIDTDLARDIPLEKATPETAAKRIVAGLEAGEEYIFTDPVSDHIGHTWRNNAPGLEAAMSGAE